MHCFDIGDYNCFESLIGILEMLNELTHFGNFLNKNILELYTEVICKDETPEKHVYACFNNKKCNKIYTILPSITLLPSNYKGIFVTMICVY